MAVYVCIKQRRRPAPSALGEDIDACLFTEATPIACGLCSGVLSSQLVRVENLASLRIFTCATVSVSASPVCSYLSVYLRERRQPVHMGTDTWRISVCVHDT